MPLVILLILCSMMPAVRAESRAIDPAEAARVDRREGGKNLWKWSVVALVAASAADAQSSYGRFEANPLLRDSQGRFSARGIAIKGAIAGGAIAAQYLFLKRNPQGARAAAVANFGMAGAFAGVAVYNHSLAARQSSSLPGYLSR